jgi:hypothetical protein
MSNFKNTFGVKSDSNHLINAFVKAVVELGWKFQSNNVSNDVNHNPNRLIYFSKSSETNYSGLQPGHFWFPDSIGNSRVDTPNFSLPLEWDEALNFANEKEIVKPYRTHDCIDIDIHRNQFIYGYNRVTRERSPITSSVCREPNSNWIGFYRSDRCDEYIDNFGDKEITVGSDNIKIVIKRDKTIAVEFNNLIFDQEKIEKYITAILCKHKMLTPMYIKPQYEVSVDHSIRFIKIGCSLFSLTELDMIYTTYCKLNNINKAKEYA